MKRRPTILTVSAECFDEIQERLNLIGGDALDMTNAILARDDDPLSGALSEGGRARRGKTLPSADDVYGIFGKPA